RGPVNEFHPNPPPEPLGRPARACLLRAILLPLAVLLGWAVPPARPALTRCECGRSPPLAARATAWLRESGRRRAADGADASHRHGGGSAGTVTWPNANPAPGTPHWLTG